MNLYCPRCWEMNGWGAEACEKCGASLRAPEEETYPQKLVWALRHRDGAVALRAATILGRLGTAEAAQALAGVLNERGGDPYVRAAAARGLASADNPEVRAALIGASESGPVMVRLAAVEALAASGLDEETAKVLRRATRDGSPIVREEAGEALARYSGAGSAHEGGGDFSGGSRPVHGGDAGARVANRHGVP